MSEQLLTVRPDQIVDNPLNPRTVVGDITDLTASIKAVGVLVPLTVRPAAPADAWDGTTYVLQAGHRRLAAARAARLTSVPVYVRDHDDTDPAVGDVTAILAENVVRENLTPIEEARAYQYLLDTGLTPVKVAKATGVKQARIKSRTLLTALPDTSQAKIQSGEWSLDVAEAMAEFADDPKALKALEDAAGTNNWSWTLQSYQRRRSAEQAREQRIAELQAAGVRLIDPPTVPSWNSAATVRELGYLAGSVDEDGDLQSLTAEEHEACPGHCAFVSGDHERYACDDWRRYGHQDLNEAIRARANNDDGSPAPSTARVPDADLAAVRAAQAKAHEELEIARRLRNDHLTAVLSGQQGGREASAHLLRWATVTLLSDALDRDLEELQRVADILGLTVPFDLDDDNGDTWEQAATWLTTQVANLKADRLIAVIAALAVPLAENELGIWTWRAYDSDTARSYYALLQRTGYEASDKELAALNPPRKDDSDDSGADVA